MGSAGWLSSSSSQKCSHRQTVLSLDYRRAFAHGRNCLRGTVAAYANARGGLMPPEPCDAAALMLGLPEDIRRTLTL